MEDQIYNSTSICGSDYDKSLSRRSVDWRDSGIVIDEDQQFNSIDAISSSFSGNNINSSTQNFLNQDEDGDTILHLAVVGCSVEKVRDLIKIGDLDAINNMMQTPLHVATLVDRPEMVSLLLSSGANLTVRDRRGNTPLHVACQKGYKETLKILLNSIEETEIAQYLEMTNFDGQTCLHLAVINNRMNILELLVEYEADLNQRDNRSGETIMHQAIGKYNLELVEFILGLRQHCNGADFSARRPLDTIKILFDSRIDNSLRDKLRRIQKLVEDRIRECANQKGCCVDIDSQLNNEILDSSSGSEYSDSDLEMH